MATQTRFDNTSESIDSVETYEFEPIQGYPMLNWKGKRPFRSTQYYPAQRKESYGEELDGWTNKIYWGDNLQVMSHLLKTYRGKINLIYIDPPFDSKADYKKKIKVRRKEVENDRTAFEEKQYTDIWTNDEYLQFMYERLILMRELLSEQGSLYLHCDWHKSHHLRLLLDEVFGNKNFVNEIIWCYTGPSRKNRFFPRKHDTILFSAKKKDNIIFNTDEIKIPYKKSHTGTSKGSAFLQNDYEMDKDGKVPEDWWDLTPVGRKPNELLGFPTQKPEALLERIIKASSNPGDIVFDCFMGSGTTQAVAMKLGRRFIGADINLGAVETTTKRLLNVAADMKEKDLSLDKWGGVKSLCIPASTSTTSTTTMYFAILLRQRSCLSKRWRFSRCPLAPPILSALCC